MYLRIEYVPFSGCLSSSTLQSQILVYASAPVAIANMRHSLVALSFLTPSVLGLALERRACNADNCLRAVTGTALGTSRLSSIASECSSYFSVTVTPATTYAYHSPQKILPLT